MLSNALQPFPEGGLRATEHSRGIVSIQCTEQIINCFQLSVEGIAGIIWVKGPQHHPPSLQRIGLHPAKLHWGCGLICGFRCFLPVAPQEDEQFIARPRWDAVVAGFEGQDVEIP